MKLNRLAPKLSRINYGFMGIDCEILGMWWYPNENKWHESNGNMPCQSWCDCKSDKAFRRRLKQWSDYLPKGTTFRLTSRWVGHDIIGKIK